MSGVTLLCPIDASHKRFCTERVLQVTQDVVVNERGVAVEHSPPHDLQVVSHVLREPAPVCDACGHDALLMTDPPP